MSDTILDMNDFHSTQFGHRFDKADVFLVLDERVKELSISFLRHAKTYTKV